ncbi:lysine N(6)-hydroxylase/L-ornithine N(5)-oxygenase family protein [Streptomyces xylophagus]|uniref:lysine N(6)-hydroxylase/L-ornithine N(5)-oxygenase family protein n=1 Tax=Streptomyces xylophagus TaxID=285514 RepID=UPI00389A4210
MDSDVVHDVLGIGFGPSNLALSIAVEEHNRNLPADRRLNALFLERQPRFGWHRGMLIDDATMQVSFLKDLVTLRNPTSDYSFLCFLREQGRLIDFLNQKTLFPLRMEFHEYFEWAAERVSHLVSYGSEVVAVDPVRGDDGEIAFFDVTTRDPAGSGSGPGSGSSPGSGRGSGTTVTRRARNISVAMGLEPHVPPGLELGERVWHNSELIPRATGLAEAGAPVRRAVVLGAGQSAAEAVDYLHRTFPDAEVCSVFAKYGYTPADDSPFANRIFDPEAVDVYFSAPSEVKQSLIDYHRSTNYSVVDMELIEALYATAYREKVAGRERLRFLNVSRIRAVDSATDGGLDVAVEFLPTGEKQVLSADVLVLATGYRPRDLSSLLGEAAKLCLRDDGDEIRVGRDHRVETVPEVTAGLYLQGGTEHTHGLTSTLLSTVAVRAEEIHRSVQAARLPV